MNVTLWKCPVCGYAMSEARSKAYAGCPTGMHIAQHVPIQIVVQVNHPSFPPMNIAGLMGNMLIMDDTILNPLALNEPDWDVQKLAPAQNPNALEPAEPLISKQPFYLGLRKYQKRNRRHL
jgi:hypothetical protein